MADAEVMPLSFLTVLQRLDDGGLLGGMQDNLRGLLKELADAELSGSRSPKGVLTLNLEVQMTEGAVHIRPESKVKTPKQRIARTLFFADARGNVYDQNPRQIDLVHEIQSIGKNEA